MCNVFCNEFKGWCRAFTKKERLFVVLEAILLVAFFGWLIFLTLHMLVCPVLQMLHNRTMFHLVEPPPTIGPEDKCTWTPSAPTAPATRYYEQDGRRGGGGEAGDWDEGEVAGEALRRPARALIKVRGPGDVVFGCFLSVVSERWALTAASCVEAIEEVDSLDSFVIAEPTSVWAGGDGTPLADVIVHPMYQGSNRSYDLVAIKAEDRLLVTRQAAFHLPTSLDYRLLTIGQKLTIIGYGKFRTPEKNMGERVLRQTFVYTLASSQCSVSGGDGGENEEGWSPRHLWGGAAVSRGRPGGRGGGCAGVRDVRGRRTPCQYCAGAPLLRGHLLYGVMSEGGGCGLACRPAPYVNIAQVRGWLEAVIAD